MTKHDRQWYEEHPQTCHHEGCVEMGWPGFYPDHDEEPIYICDAHAYEEGFCAGCHVFMLGSEEFFELKRVGLCWDCFEDLKIEMGEYDEEAGYDDYL